MNMRSAISLSDLAEAFYWLSPTDLAVDQVAAILGFQRIIRPQADKKCLDTAPREVGRKHDKDHSSAASQPHQSKQSDERAREPAIGNGIEISCLGNTPHPISIPAIVANATPLLEFDSTLPPRSKFNFLIPQHLTRYFIYELLARKLPGEELDIEAAVEQLAQCRFTALDRIHRNGLHNGVEVLIDDGPAMQPFHSDIRELSEQIKKIIGPNLLRHSIFRTFPFSFADSNAIERPENSYTPYPGATILLITDLGIGHPPGSWRASSHEWNKFVRRLIASGCHVIALLPYGPKVWPKIHCIGFRAVSWGHKGRAETDTSVEDFARILSVAAILDTTLIREARRKLFSNATAGLEANLLFSDLVQVWNSRIVSLRDDALREFREQLISLPLERARATQFLQKYRDSVGTTRRVRYEETLVAAAIEGAVDEVAQCLARIVRTILENHGNASMARWASTLIRRLPIVSDKMPIYEQVRVAAEMELGLAVNNEQISFKERWMLPPETEVEVLWRAGKLVLREPPIENENIIRVPSTMPRHIHMQPMKGNDKQLYVWPKQGDCIVDVDLPVKLRTLSGMSYWVEHENAAKNSTDNHYPASPVLQKDSIAITPDGKLILMGSANIVHVFDASSAQEVARFAGHTGAIYSVNAFSDNILALSGGKDRTLQLWKLNSGRHLKTIDCGMADADDIFSSAVNPTGTMAVSGHRDGGIRLWNLETGEFLAALKGHSGFVYSVQITPNGRFAISGSEDTTVKVWDLERRACIGTLEGHNGKVYSVAISPDSTLIASTGFIDHTVRLWDFNSGASLWVIKQDAFPISVAFSPDGSRLVAGTTDGEVYVYRISDIRAMPPAEPTRRYVNAKVVLLGEGSVGKTSLAYRLIEDRYVVKDRTHGMNVWPLELPLPSDATMDREALLWDLAGQEDYRLIHRLFLDETALALLLINPQKDDPFAEAWDWLKALDTATNPVAKRKAERLLVFSQVDVGGMKISDAKIERFAQDHGFADWLATSAKTGQNCSDAANGGQASRLKQLIADRIPWDKLPWTATPRLLAEMKEALLKMRDTTDIRLLRFSELAQRLEQALPSERFGQSDVRTAVTLLANHGLALPLKFGDLVLLQPELLNGYAGAVIRAARAHQDEIGCVLEADIYDPNFDFTGVDRLPRPDEELLLRVIVQIFLDHSLCIAEDTTQGRQLVFPSQYRRDKDIPWHPDVFVSYTFDGEWQTIWTTLLVRLWYSQEFKHRELWRNAAEFASSRGNLLGLKIDNRQGEGEATISLFFDLKTPDEVKVIFIEYVHRNLARYGSNVKRDRRYVCGNCGKPVMDYAEVRKRLAAGKKFIICQRCDEKVELIDFIEQRLESDPVARKILDMDETATRQLDTQALEQILIGHMMAVCGEANQIFRPVSLADYGIDGEVEFKDSNGQHSGKKIYVQLKSGNSYLRTRRKDGREVFDVKNDRHLEYWISQPVDVYLVVRQTDERTGEEAIRWMNVTRYLKNRKDKKSRRIIFQGEALTMQAVWKLRDEFFRV